jgi:hypothetical protein
MYRFPHPLTLHPDGLSRCRLIVPVGWKVADPRLKRVDTVDRTVSARSLRGYSIRLDGKTKAIKDVIARDGKYSVSPSLQAKSTGHRRKSNV